MWSISTEHTHAFFLLYNEPLQIISTLYFVVLLLVSLATFIFPPLDVFILQKAVFSVTLLYRLGCWCTPTPLKPIITYKICLSTMVILKKNRKRRKILHPVAVRKGDGAKQLKTCPSFLAWDNSWSELYYLFSSVRDLSSCKHKRTQTWDILKTMFWSPPNAYTIYPQWVFCFKKHLEWMYTATIRINIRWTQNFSQCFKKVDK